MTQSEQAHWPCIDIGGEGSSAVRLEDASCLLRTTFQSIAAVNRSGISLIDSHSNAFLVKNMRLRQPVGRLRLTLYRIANPFVDVEVDFVPQGTISLLEVKKRLKHNLDVNADFWAEYGEMKDLSEALDGCRTLDEVFLLTFLR
ncbi:MAG: hypothetical protein ABFD92_06115 [Planctomycetaceae bacterium]|nr:hypothetical protein [Planctomycetaceae bacterium]